MWCIPQRDHLTIIGCQPQGTEGLDQSLIGIQDAKLDLTTRPIGPTRPCKTASNLVHVHRWEPCGHQRRGARDQGSGERCAAAHSHREIAPTIQRKHRRRRRSEFSPQAAVGLKPGTARRVRPRHSQNTFI